MQQSEGSARARRDRVPDDDAGRARDPQTCSDVKMAAPGWTDIDATNAMAGVVLKALGYRQDVANLSVPITYQGPRKGRSTCSSATGCPRRRS